VIGVDASQSRNVQFRSSQEIMPKVVIFEFAERYLLRRSGVPLEWIKGRSLSVSLAAGGMP